MELLLRTRKNCYFGLRKCHRMLLVLLGVFVGTLWGMEPTQESNQLASLRRVVDGTQHEPLTIPSAPWPSEQITEAVEPLHYTSSEPEIVVVEEQVPVQIHLSPRERFRYLNNIHADQWQAGSIRARIPQLAEDQPNELVGRPRRIAERFFLRLDTPQAQLDMQLMAIRMERLGKVLSGLIFAVLLKMMVTDLLDLWRSRALP